MTFWQLAFDANDPGLLASFWAKALGYHRAPPRESNATWDAHYRARLGDDSAYEDRLFHPAGEGPPIWFQRVPEPKAGKNRLHLDLYPTARDDDLSLEQRIDIIEEKVAELVALGARVHRRAREDDPGDLVYYVVLNDPEGNEFCVS